MPHLLIVSQVYIPDPTSVGQHMADVAEEMVKRGWDVTVLTSNRGYDDPDTQFPSKETVNGVHVKRLSFSSFGKKSILHRLLGQAFFCSGAILKGLFCERFDSLFITTSPPMGGVVGWMLSLLKNKPVSYWVMDLNPDQAVAQGIVPESALSARVFDWINRKILKRASSVIPMDSFMAERLENKLSGVEKTDLAQKITPIRPWPMEDSLERVPLGENPFIEEHNLEGKTVVMYSGNHSPVHPLKTFLDAAKFFEGNDRLHFLFIGGGKGKQEVEQFITENPKTSVLSLPYQPLDKIKYSLSAATVHMVSMGESMIGCVHPCKFYGAMTLEKPILYLGPQKSHIGAVMESREIGWQVDHGDLTTMTKVLEEILNAPPSLLAEKGKNGRNFITSEASKSLLCPKLSRILEDDFKTWQA